MWLWQGGHSTYQPSPLPLRKRTVSVRRSDLLGGGGKKEKAPKNKQLRSDQPVESLPNILAERWPKLHALRSPGPLSAEEMQNSFSLGGSPTQVPMQNSRNLQAARAAGLRGWGSRGDCARRIQVCSHQSANPEASDKSRSKLTMRSQSSSN